MDEIRPENVSPGAEHNTSHVIGPHVGETQGPEEAIDSSGENEPKESIGPGHAHGKGKLTNLEAALQYAGFGFEVFPVNPDTKQSHKSEKYSGSKWGKTSDPDQIKKDWDKWPDANVGIATGKASGIWVIDLDVKDGGLGVWDELVGDQPLPLTVTVETPSGGRHYWFNWPEDGGIFNTVRKLGPGVDVRGQDGIVVAPPSVKAGKGRYAFADGLSPDEVEIAKAPEWLLEKVRNASRKNRQSGTPTAKTANEIGLVAQASAKHKIGNRAADQIRRLGLVKEGERNDTLNRVGFTLGGLAHHLAAEEVLRELLEAVGGWDDPEKTLETAERSFRDGEEKPIPLDLGVDDLLLSHEDLAEYAMQTTLGKNYINVFEWGWHEWSDHTWKAVDDRVVEGEVASHLRAICNEVDLVAAAEAERARANAQSGNNSGARSPGKVLLKAKSHRNALGSVHYDRAVAQKLGAKNGTSASGFNADPLLLGTPGGVVDLRTGKLRPGRRDDLISRNTAVVPSFETPERWLQFLDEAFPGQPEMIEFLQRLSGCALTGLTRDEKIFFLYGTGRNGKGVFMETLLFVLGDYSAKASADVFLSNVKAENTQNDLANMDGARLVWGDEIPVGRKWDTAMIKNLTGGDTIVAKRLYKDKYSFKPQANIFIAGNTKPGISGVDVAIRERLVLVPFDQTFDKDKADPKLKGYLANREASTILGWQIEGARKYLKDGLAIPEAIRKASAEYLDSEDALMQFVEDCCVVEEGAFIASNALYPAYKEWAEEQGLRVLGQRTLTSMLGERGFQSGKQGGGKRGVHGLRLKSGDEVLM